MHDLLHHSWEHQTHKDKDSNSLEQQTMCMWIVLLLNYLTLTGTATTAPVDVTNSSGN